MQDNVPTTWKAGDATRQWAETRIVPRQCLFDLRQELQAKIQEGEFSRELSRKLDAVEILLEE